MFAQNEMRPVQNTSQNKNIKKNYHQVELNTKTHIFRQAK